MDTKYSLAITEKKRPKVFRIDMSQRATNKYFQSEIITDNHLFNDFIITITLNFDWKHFICCPVTKFTPRHRKYVLLRKTPKLGVAHTPVISSKRHKHTRDKTHTHKHTHTHTHKYTHTHTHRQTHTHKTHTYTHTHTSSLLQRRCKLL